MHCARTVSSRRLLALCLALAVSRVQGSDTAEPAAPSSPPESAPSFTYDGAGIVDAVGGLSRSSTYVGNLHWRASLDLGRTLGWSDSRFFVDALWIHGGAPDAFVGDAMGVSNIAAPPGAQIEELWVEHDLRTADLSILLGLYDLNSEFDRVQSGALFLNSAFGIGPEFAQSGVEGPSIFPRTSAGLRAAWKPADNVVVRAAVLDGVPLIRADDRIGVFESGDGLLGVAELALLDRPVTGDPGDPRQRIGRTAMLPAYEGKLAVGAWHYTTTFDRLDEATPSRQHGTSGAYLVGDRVVARDPENAGRTLSTFIQLGMADDRVNRFGTYVGAGLVAAGPLRARPDDELGFAVAVARNGSAFRRESLSAAPTSLSETTVELSYLIQATPWLALQPDLQYVIHPDTDPAISNALVFTLRFEIALH